MKKLSLKMRITIWYSVFLLLIAALAFVVVYLFSEQMLWSKTSEDLREITSEFAEDLEISENGYGMDAEDSFYEDDVLLSIYDNMGAIQDGTVPADFPVDTTLKNGKVQKINGTGQQWMTYDVAVDFGGNKLYWVRGIVNSGQVSQMAKAMLTAAFIICPVLVLLAAGGGWLITKKAFAPVEQIRKAAAEIGQGKDLKKRIHAPDARGELHELAETFNEMLGQLEEAFENEKQFTSDASHELRTPAAVILAQSEYGLLEDTTKEEQKETLQVIHDQAVRMSGLIRQLLMIARSERTEGMENLEKVDVSQVIRIAAESVQMTAEEKGIQVSLELEEGICADAEETGMVQIFRNLIENAVQYGRDSGHVWVTAKVLENRIQCTVRDDGIGIRKEELPHIWKRFYRSDKVRNKSDTANAGLGLSMVKMLTARYGGKAEVRSEYGEGTVFTVTFPKSR